MISLKALCATAYRMLPQTITDERDFPCVPNKLEFERGAELRLGVDQFFLSNGDSNDET